MSYPGDPALAPDVQQRILTTFQQTLELAAKGSRQEALLGCDFILRLDQQFGPARTLQQMINAGRSGAELAALFGGAAVGAPGVDPEAQARAEAEPYIRKFLESARKALAAGDAAEADRLVNKARSLDATHPEIASFESERAATLPELPGFDLPDVDFSAPSSGSLLDAPDSGSMFGSPAPSGEGAGRIQELLNEGQRAFERGEYQGAIDAWSRIFLIDIDHHEAARRIEDARRLKAEREREVEELFHGGVAQFDSAAFDDAEASFRRVLELSPGYVLAQEYLEKIAERRSGGPAVPPPPTSRGDAPGDSGSRAAARPTREKPQGEIMVPPDPGDRRSRSKEDRPGYAVAAKKRGGPSPNFFLIGGAVLALLVVGGWLLIKNRASLFPNAKGGDPPAAAAAASPIARAQALHAEGKTAIALAQLRRLPPQDPAYAEAQSLISQWEALVKPAEPVPAGLPPELKARRDALVAEAESALRAGENLLARRRLDQAAAIQALDAPLTAMREGATRNLAPLEGELKMFADGEYEAGLNRLWRLREAEPANRDVRQLIVDCYHNLGVIELQRGDLAAAADRFREARELDREDVEIERLERFALVYTERPNDLLFQIFVRNLVNR
jgi:tetratricopeptide (TPR) repeat protein